MVDDKYVANVECEEAYRMKNFYYFFTSLSFQIGTMGISRPMLLLRCYRILADIRMTSVVEDGRFPSSVLNDHVFPKYPDGTDTIGIVLGYTPARTPRLLLLGAPASLPSKVAR